MAAILTVQGGIIMQNRQIDGHGLYLSLLAGAGRALPCGGAGLVARPQPETAAPRLLKDSGGHVALYTADGIGPLATYDDLYTRLLPESDVLALQQGVFVADEAGIAAAAGGLWAVKPVRSEHCGKRSVGASIARPGKAEAAADFPGGYGIRPVQGSMLVIDPETCGISSLLTFFLRLPRFYAIV